MTDFDRPLIVQIQSDICILCIIYIYTYILRETKIVRVPDTLELLQMSFLLGAWPPDANYEFLGSVV